MQRRSHVSLARLAEHPAVNRIVAGSIPAGYVATLLWQAIAFGFSFIIKHFFPTIRQPAAGAFGLVRFQAPVYF